MSFLKLKTDKRNIGDNNGFPEMSPFSFCVGGLHKFGKSLQLPTCSHGAFMYHILYNTVFLIGMNIPALYMKNGYAYVFTKLNKERDTANMKTRLNEKYFLMVIAMWYKTNNRSTVSLYPSNNTNIQIISTQNIQTIPFAFSRFLELKLTQLPQLRFSLHKILLLQHSPLVSDVCVWDKKFNNLFWKACPSEGHNFPTFCSGLMISSIMEETFNLFQTVLEEIVTEHLQNIRKCASG